MDTLGMQPAQNATVLFNNKDFDNWTTREGNTVGWRVEEGIAHVVPGAGDIVSRECFRDFFLHLEFRCPDMPEATGQAKGNSGVFLHGCYEIQVLDSYGIDIPGKGDCGAIYNQFAPLTNGCKAAMEWQTYDVWFRAPRPDVGEGPRLTVLHNGQVIHNNCGLPGTTAQPIHDDFSLPGPLLLQEHAGDLVSYRNIWAYELPLVGSDTYEPR